MTERGTPTRLRTAVAWVVSLLFSGAALALLDYFWGDDGVDWQFVILITVIVGAVSGFSVVRNGTR